MNNNNDIDKTIDESVMGQVSEPTGSITPGVTGVSGNAPNPYLENKLPSGKERIKIGTGVIAGLLGVGGMAKVYKVWNGQLEVFRAVKLLLPSGQKDLAKRFETEIKITAKLHHPNIVEIYNVGEWNGLPYIEMELVEGFTLDKLVVKRGKLPAPVCSAILIQITRALSYAHTHEFLIYGKTYKGIIHRDLKPANIMISNVGDLKLMDFGIARPTEVGLHTMDGHVVGTLQYLSPEQLDGADIDNRTDIYSLGTILYEILTGTKTFPQATITNLMRMKATNKYRKFSELKINVPDVLTKITEKCLNIEKNKRYPDAEALLEALKLAHNSFTTDSPREVLKKYIHNPDTFIFTLSSRKRLPWYIKGGIAAALVAGCFTLLFTLFPGIDLNTIFGKSKEVTDTTITHKTPVVKKTPAESTETLDNKKDEEIIDDKKKKSETTVALKRKKDERPPIKKYKRPEPKKPITKKVKKKPKSLSPLARLQEKYEVVDFLDVGEKACKAGNYSDAVTALKAVEGNGPKKMLYLLWAYVEMKNFTSAKNIVATSNINDAFAELLKGRIGAYSGMDKKALSYYQSALTKPSTIKNRNQIRNDALFYTALIHDKHYRQFPSEQTRLQALTAWNNLKKVYRYNTNHPRFKLANKKLAMTN